MSSQRPLGNLIGRVLAVPPAKQPNLLQKNPAAKTSKGIAPESSSAKQVFQGQNSPKKQKKVPRLEQWVEVRLQDGRAVTTLYPSNEQLIKEGQKMMPPPEMIYRRINFPDGIPPEYDWTAPLSEEQKQRGGCGIQRLTVDAWLDVIELEKQREDGHIGPAKTGNLPRPKETGGCECPACTAKEEDLEAMARLIGA